MLEAGAWGLLGAASLLVGALIGTGRRAIPTRVLGLILGFGAGTLLSAVAFELTGMPWEHAEFRALRGRIRRWLGPGFQQSDGPSPADNLPPGDQLVVYGAAAAARCSPESERSQARCPSG